MHPSSLGPRFGALLVLGVAGCATGGDASGGPDDAAPADATTSDGATHDARPSDGSPSDGGSSSESGADGATVDGGGTPPDAGMSTDAAPDAGVPQCATVTGLLAYYPLATDTLDHWSSNNATSTGTLTYAAGKLGPAAVFDGTTTMIHVGGAMTLAGGRTFCAWVNPTSRASLGQPIFSEGSSGAGDFMSLQASSPASGGCTSAAASEPFLDHWGGSCQAAPPALTLAAGSFHLLCYAYDGSQTVTFFGDGASSSFTGALYSSTLSSVYIGSASIGGTTTAPSLLGSIQEVTVWDRALGSSDFAALWNDGAGCHAM